MAAHGLRHAEWFEQANAILIGGHTAAQDSVESTPWDAVLDALEDRDVPIVFDVESGHVPPVMPLVNRTLERVTVTDKEQSIVL